MIYANVLIPIFALITIAALSVARFVESRRNRSLKEFMDRKQNRLGGE